MKRSSFEKIVDGFLTVAVLALVALVFLNVVLRYTIGSGFNFAEEISRIIFVWITFIGAASAFRYQEHLGYDTFINKLPPPFLKIARSVVSMTILLMLFIIVYGAFKLGYLGIDTSSPATGIPLLIFYVPVILMSVSMIFMELRRLLTGMFLSEQGAMEEDE